MEYIKSTTNLKSALNLIDSEQIFSIIIMKKYEKGIFMCNTIYSIDDIKTLLHPVFVKHNVKKAVLFGYYVKGLANKNSDVDLLLDS